MFGLYIYIFFCRYNKFKVRLGEFRALRTVMRFLKATSIGTTVCETRVRTISLGNCSHFNINAWHLSTHTAELAGACTHRWHHLKVKIKDGRNPIRSTRSERDTHALGETETERFGFMVKKKSWILDQWVPDGCDRYVYDDWQLNREFDFLLSLSHSLCIHSSPNSHTPEQEIWFSRTLGFKVWKLLSLADLINDYTYIRQTQTFLSFTEHMLRRYALIYKYKVFVQYIL